MPLGQYLMRYSAPKTGFPWLQYCRMGEQSGPKVYLGTGFFPDGWSLSWSESKQITVALPTVEARTAVSARRGGKCFGCRKSLGPRSHLHGTSINDGNQAAMPLAPREGGHGHVKHTAMKHLFIFKTLDRVKLRSSPAQEKQCRRTLQ